MSRPVLVVGAAPRAGGDLVAGILARHPRLHRPPVPLERDLVVGAERIVQGALDVARGVPAPAGDGGDELVGRLGREVVAWLQDRSGTPAGSRLVALLDAPDGLTAVTRLAVGADLVLVVRDGREVVAEARRDGDTFERPVRAWLSGTRAILSVVGRPLPPDVRVRLVRHEALVDDAGATIGSLVAWLGLSPSAEVLTAATQVRAAEVPALTPLDEARFALRATTETRALDYAVRATPVGTTVAAAAVESAYGVRRLAGRILT